MQTQIERKKRTSTSGSRSKSKKSANNIKSDQTVELKPKSFHIFHNQDISAKVKTQNSLSLHKNKGPRKNTKSLKRPEKQNDFEKKATAKQSKDHSYLVSAERKYSVNKITKTQATHIQNEDIYKKLYSIKKHLNKMKVPQQFSISQIQDYFSQIKQSLTHVAIQPLQYIFQKLHSMYVTPIENFLNIIRPYQSILKRKQQISHLIKQQIQENQKLYQQLDPQDIQIIKLKEKIKKNAEMIQDMKKKKLQTIHISMKKKKSPQSQHQQSKFIDLSNQEQLISDRINHTQFESKLVQQYEKSRVFQAQMKTMNLDKNQIQKNKNQSFTEALHTSQGKNRDIKVHDDKQQQKKLKTHSEDDQAFPNSKGLNPDNNEERQQNGEVQQGQNKMGLKSAGISFSFKLDLPKIDRSNLGFHDEFYSKLDEFSESWRNQALRQKRF